MIKKMDKSCHCRVMILITVLAALCSVAEIISKSVCLGESIRLFQNITFTSFKVRVTLYKIGAGRREPMVILFPNASGIFAEILVKYRSKIFFENGTIMLRNFQSSDEATYAILSDGQSEGEKEEIRALTPPPKPCKPKLQQVANFLTASIDNPDCYGRPAVSVYWMENSGISNKNQTMLLELKNGSEACTYHACIEGEALRCAKISTPRDYCENITVGSKGEDNNPTPSSDTPQSTTNIWKIVAIVVSVAFAILILAALFVCLWKRICPGGVCLEAKWGDDLPSQFQIVAGGETGEYEMR